MEKETKDKGEPCARCFEAGWPVPDGYEVPEHMADELEVRRCADCGRTVLVVLEVEGMRERLRDREQ